jgi:MFS family permease
MHLFKNEVFSISVVLSLLAGLVLFAAILFIPEYQQYVLGYSAVKSGLLLLPLVVGMLAALISVGRIITKTGHYKIFPIIGTVVVAIGLWLFSHLTIGTSQLVLSAWMVVLGIGVGSFLQVMTLAVQNAVPRSELGVATATATFFRSMGSSLGGAVFGAILINRLLVHLKTNLPAAARGHVSLSPSTIENGIPQSALHSLPPAVTHGILQSYVMSFHDMFLLAIPFAALAFVVALFLKEIPLRSAPKATEVV